MTQDLKQRIAEILTKAKEIKQYALASEIDSDCIDYLIMTDIIKELTAREEKLVFSLKEAVHYAGGHDGVKYCQSGTGVFHVDTARATLKGLGVPIA